MATQRIDVSPQDAQDVLALAPYFDTPVRDAQKRFGMSEGSFVRAFRLAHPALAVSTHACRRAAHTSRRRRRPCL